MTKTDRKTAIVTGSSRGIGAAILGRLAEDGFNVVVNYTQNQAIAEERVAEIIAKGGQAIAVCADIACIEAIDHLFTATSDAFGGVDVVVNNAGIMPPGRPAYWTAIQP